MAVKPTTGNVAYYLSNLKTSLADYITTESIKHPMPTSKVEAARDVAMAVSNTHFACEYSKVLLTLRDKVNDTVKGHLNELESMLEALKSDNNDSILALTNRVQNLIQSLKLADGPPKWTGMSPRYAYVVSGRFNVIISGIFTHAIVDVARYNLTIKNCLVEKKKQADSLSFDLIPQEGFFPEWANSISYLFEGELEVEYKYYALSYKAKYSVWLATHPLACKVSLSVPSIKTIKHTFRSATYNLDRKDFNTKEEIERKQTIWATDGWRITSTPKFYSTVTDEHHPKGKMIDNYLIMILTLPKGRDKISAYLEFEESKDVYDTKEVTTSSHELLWGKSLEINSQKFKLEFSFGDMKYTVSPTQLENPCFTIEKQPDNTYKATLVPPPESTKV